MEDNFEKIKDMTVEEFFNAFVDLLVSKKDKETIKEKLYQCIYSKDGSELVAIPWQYNGALSIKEGTTKIGQEAFWTQGASSSETTKLTSVHIPASVTTIESSQLTALNKLVGRITITIDEANPNYTISSGKIVSK